MHSKNVGWNGCEMQMQKQHNCQEMLCAGVKLRQKNLLKCCQKVLGAQT